jgi:hypothetical protein
MDSVLKERRIEFAFEGQYWLDLVRLSYWNPTKAVNILNNQQRVTFAYANGIATPDAPIGTAVLPATISSFTLQIPASELAADPNLAEPPVKYF